LGIKLLVPAIASILILGSFGMDQQAFGQVESSTAAGGDNNPPDYRSDDCSLTFSFIPDPSSGLLVGSIIHDQGCTKGPLNSLPINVEYKPGVCPAEVTGQGIPACEALHLTIPNFIDNLLTKKVRIQVLYDQKSSTPSVKHPGGVKEDVNPGVPEVNPEICFRDAAPVNTQTPGFFFEDWTCHPNPVNEVIWFDITGSVIQEIVVDTVSFGMAVGGDIIPLDSTMVLAAGAQYTAAWMIPVIVSGIGFAIVIARKF